jgi:hypothetical protein
MTDNQLTEAPRVTGADLSAGGAVQAIVPRDFEGAWRIAQVVVSAKMVPKSFEEKDGSVRVERVCVAIMHGMEVGLTPMMALQSIAVVNGMPVIYGDGMLGLVRKSGLLDYIDERVEIDDNGEPTIAICKVKRKGEPHEVVQTFTRVEATKAGLWNKAGPWSQGYRQRMMKFRARSWALRDKFPDVLRGLHSGEEVEDMIDITSRGSATTAPPEPRRSDSVGSGERPPRPPEQPEGTAAAQASSPSSTGPASPPHTDEAGPPEGNARGGNDDAGNDPPRNWKIGDDVMGQQAFIKHATDLLALAHDDADVDALLAANSLRIAKITGLPMQQWIAAVRKRREEIKAGP